MLQWHRFQVQSSLLQMVLCLRVLCLRGLYLTLMKKWCPLQIGLLKKIKTLLNRHPRHPVAVAFRWTLEKRALQHLR